MNTQPHASSAPTTDPLRGTGRTERRVRRALLAVLLGKRVIFVSKDGDSARSAYQMAVHMLREQQDIGVTGGVTYQTSPRLVATITTYRMGVMLGQLQFVSMDFDVAKFNRGLEGALLFYVVNDHTVEEELADRAAKLERTAAKEQVKMLMDKYGWECVQPSRKYTDGRKEFWLSQSTQDED